MTEKQLQQAIVDYARLAGWLVFHPHDSRRSEPGFPDLVLVRDRVIFAELKTDDGRMSKEQSAWTYALAQAGAEVYLWRPSDWFDGRVEHALRRHVAARRAA